MKMYYITLNSVDTAKAISLSLLEKHLAACTNWFPISSMYRWENEIRQDEEIVLIVKTKENQRVAIEKVVAEHISYTNCIVELGVHSANKNYLDWLNAEVKNTKV